MTTVAVPRVAAPRRRDSSLAGFGQLYRLNLRRERIPLLCWVYGLTLVVFSTLSALAGLYPTMAERQGLATGIAANAGMVALLGRIQSLSIGGLTAWRVGVLAATGVGLMAIMTVVRRTRADEESGRSELLAAGVVGRSAPLVAALATAWSAALAIGLLVAGVLIIKGENTSGAIAFGGALAGGGFVYAAVAAVAAQLVDSARGASALAGVVLAAGYLLRAAGDVSQSVSWLTWLSPLGWLGHVNAYGSNNFAVLALDLLVTAVLTVIAVWLSGRRDLGAGMFVTRLGPATSASLRSPLALAARLHRGQLVGWLVGLVALGAVIGSVSADAEAVIGSSPGLVEMIRQLGGPGALGAAVLAVVGSFVGMIAAVLAISAALRLRAEETTGHTEAMLATAVSRVRWMGSHLVFVIVGPTVGLAIAGLSAGLVYGSRSGTMSQGLRAGFDALMVQAPATLVMGGLAAALFGWLPKYTEVAWGALGVAVVLGQIGALLKLPRTIMDLSPFSHTPLVPVETMRWLPVVLLLAVAAGLMVLGLAGFRRRDVG